MQSAYDESQIRRLDLTGPERRLGGAVKALGQIAERFAKGAKRSMPFLGRQKARLIAGDVTLGATPASESETSGPGYKVQLESTEDNTWALVRLDTGAVAAILDGSLGAGPMAAELELSEIFGKELTVAQRALVGKVATSIAEDFASAVTSFVGLSVSISGSEPQRAAEPLELPKDAICVCCAFEGSGVPANVELYIGAEVLEAAVQEAESVGHSAGDPRMAAAIRGVTVPVVAELGRLELDLGRVLSLNVGETLRLETAVDEPIRLRVAGMGKFDVVPVVSRGQLAVQIQDRVRNEE